MIYFSTELKIKLTVFLFIFLLVDTCNIVHCQQVNYRFKVVKYTRPRHEDNYHRENESSKRFIDSSEDFLPQGTIFSRSKSKEQPQAAAQTAQFIMVPNINGQFISPAQVQAPQQTGALVQPILVQATAPPTLRLPPISLNVVSPVRQVGFSFGQTAPLVTNQPVIQQPAVNQMGINPMLAAALIAGAAGGPGRGRLRGARGRGRQRGRGRRRRPGQLRAANAAFTAARLRQVAMMSALQMQQAAQLQATVAPAPQMQILQPIIVQTPESNQGSSSSAPLREREVNQAEKVRTIVQPVVQPIVAEPITLPTRYKERSPSPVRHEYDSPSSYSPASHPSSSYSHQSDSHSYPRIRQVSRPSSYYGYSTGSSYYRTPSGGIVNQIVIQPPSATSGTNSILKKTRKKMRAKAVKKLIKMLDE